LPLKVSIIIPTLNEEKLLESTLRQFSPSLKKLFNIETIISDGRSKDKTIKIAEEFADKVVLPPDSSIQNISKGRNLGAGAASGNILYFMNADTRIPDIEGFFLKTTGVFKNTSVAAIACPIKVFPEEEKLSDKLFHFCYNNYVNLLNKTGMGMGRGECHIVRKSIFTKVNGYNEELAAGEDYDLYKRIRGYGKIKFLSDVVVFESPRRYRKYGYLSVFADWTRNSLSVLFRNKSVSKSWDPVR
jgi:glycosyltransferase involved in cell wall biosynthesis